MVGMVVATSCAVDRGGAKADSCPAVACRKLAVLGAGWAAEVIQPAGRASLPGLVVGCEAGGKTQPE